MTIMVILCNPHTLEILVKCVKQGVKPKIM